MPRVKFAIWSRQIEFRMKKKNIHLSWRFWRRSSAQKSDDRATWYDVLYLADEPADATLRLGFLGAGRSPRECGAHRLAPPGVGSRTLAAAGARPVDRLSGRAEVRRDDVRVVQHGLGVAVDHDGTEVHGHDAVGHAR